MIRKILGSFFVCMAVLLCAVPVRAEEARQLEVTAAAEDGSNTSGLQDDSYTTTLAFKSGTSLTLTCAEPMAGLYIEWAKEPAGWQLKAGGVTKNCGENGFLHEYVALDTPAAEVTLTMPEGNVMCNIQGWSKGELPASVQVWRPSCDRADMLVLSSHADDEILFLGGVLAEYAGQRKLAVQVIYFSDYTNGTVVREHEKLDGLWTVGVRNYPENGGFDDLYADDLEAACKIFDYEKTLGWVVEMIRKYQPQICVAQDTNGEYGHGTHQLTSKAMQEAVEISMDGSRFPESAALYGRFDVPKTYLHLHGENKLFLDCRRPLSAFGGQTALDVASAAYKQHVSQQWCWFYVSDTYEYSISEFGLYRTTVGTDTANDMMEHLVSYEEQERLRQEAYERESREQQSREEAESASKAQAQSESVLAEQENMGAAVKTAVLWVVIALLVLAFGFCLYVYYVNQKRKRKRRKKKRR